MTPGELGETLAELLPGWEPAGPAEALAGGLMNHVWRVPGRPGSVVAKYAPPHVAAAPEIPVDPARLGFEARALARLGADLAGLPGARAPGLRAYDPARSLLVLEDLGPLRDLATRAAAGEIPPGEGAALGRFVGALHATTRGDPGLAREHDNAAVQATRQAVQYDAVAGMLAGAGLEAARAGARAAALGARLRGPGRCLVMGDLWPPGVARTTAGELVVLDWEFSHFGQPAQDLGHLAAHLWMLADRAGDPARRAALGGYRAGLLVGYREGAGAAAEKLLDARTLEDAATHAGCEVLARTLGPFAGGFLYEGDPAAARAAAIRAAAWIEGREPGPLG